LLRDWHANQTVKSKIGDLKDERKIVIAAVKFK